MAKKVLMESLTTDLHELEEQCAIYILKKKHELPGVLQLIPQRLPLDSFFKWIMPSLLLK